MLDDVQKIAEIDSAKMFDAISGYPEQIRESCELAENKELETFIKIDNVVITGMGASAISGDILSCLFRDKCDVPIVVNREYELPRWAKKDTLTIFVSYSGDTEETISAFKHAFQKKCKIVCISSGGRLQELCEVQGVSHVKIPAGFQPRAATMNILFPLIVLFRRFNLIKQDLAADIDETIELAHEFVAGNSPSVPLKNNLSKQLATQLHKSIPQIYGWGVYAPIAVRWRQQFNENSKIIARADVVSESNHNDIVAWSANPEVSKQFSCLLFRDRDSESRNMMTRLDFLKSLFNDTAKQVLEIPVKGKSRLAKMMYLMFLGDFSSCYLAVLRHIDPSPVDVIMELKDRLSEL